MAAETHACSECRRALSAQLDNEATIDDLVVVAAHLPECESCRRHGARAGELRRRSIRYWPEPAVASPLAAALSQDAGAADHSTMRIAAFPGAAGPVRRFVDGLATLSGPALALAIVGATQLLLSIANVARASDHSVRHLAAWSAVFGVVLILGACYPERASILAPVAVAVPMMMLATSASDWRSAVAGLGEPVHLLELIGAGLLLWVAHQSRTSRPRSSLTSAAT